MVGITENVDGIISTGLGTISSPAFPHFCQKQIHPTQQQLTPRSCFLSCAGSQGPCTLPASSNSVLNPGI